MNWPTGMGPSLVTLVNGELVWSDAEEWRSECEARQVSQMAPHRQRDYLFEIERVRGVAGATHLRETMRAVQEVAA